MKAVITQTSLDSRTQVGAYIKLRGVSSPEWFVVTKVISKTCVEVEPDYDYEQVELKAALLLTNLVVYTIVFYLALGVFT